MQRLKSIIFIDDDHATNLLNLKTIHASGFDGEVEVFRSAEDALIHLTSKKNGTYPRPNIVFLDLNMPGMDGWGFLKQFSLLHPAQLANAKVIILTSSVDPTDKKAALQNSLVADFVVKPLKQEEFKGILKRHF
ncbi:response regulator [bacterium]|nr:response regulator [bacterium]